MPWTQWRNASCGSTTCTNRVRPAQPNLAQVIRDRDGNFQLLATDGWVQSIGQVGPIGPGFVCVQARKGLDRPDPITGTVLWAEPT